MKLRKVEIAAAAVVEVLVVEVAIFVVAADDAVPHQRKSACPCVDDDAG